MKAPKKGREGPRDGIEGPREVRYLFNFYAGNRSTKAEGRSTRLGALSLVFLNFNFPKNTFKYSKSHNRGTKPVKNNLFYV